MKLQDSLYKPFQHWAANGKIYIISDTHFGETQIYGNEYDEYTDEERAAIINKGLGKNDTLIHLGDVGDVEKMKLIKPCYKVLLLGNHDAGASKYLDFLMKFMKARSLLERS